MKKHIIAGVTFAAMLTLDIITKFLVDTNIEVGERHHILGSFLQITKVYNTGGVFGIMQGHKTFFLIVSIIVFILLLGFYIYEKNKSVFFTVAMGLIFSGAIGNILDRLMQKPGVVDFIYMGIEGKFMWPAYNVADMCIVCGAFLLGGVFFYEERKASLEAKKAADENGDNNE